MPFPITPDELAKAYGATGAADFANALLPLFGTGDYVFIISEYTRTSGDSDPFVYNPYKVLSRGEITFNSDPGGTNLVKAYDSTLTAAALATGAAAADSPAFFTLQDQRGNVRRDIHCSLVESQADMESRVGTEVQDWPTPSF